MKNLKFYDKDNIIEKQIENENETIYKPQFQKELAFQNFSSDRPYDSQKDDLQKSTNYEILENTLKSKQKLKQYFFKKPSPFSNQ